MNQEILKFCLEKGFILDKELFDSISQIENTELAKKIVEQIRQIYSERLITKTILFKNTENLQKIVTSFNAFDAENKKIIEKLFITLGLNIEIIKEKTIKEEKELEKEMAEPLAQAIEIIEPLIAREIREKSFKLEDFSPVKIIASYPALTKKIVVADFVKHFRNRFLEMKRLLEDRQELQNLISINKINSSRQNISVIGSVLKKRTTQNKNIFLEIEDLTGRINAIVNHDKLEVYKKAKEILLDDVIALRCSGSREAVFVNDIFYPDISLAEKKYAKREEFALFTSDLHVGSDKFLEENFLKFIDWINGKLNHREESQRAKYLFITGDCVDGVGIYPGQEEQLAIKDIKKQYEKLAELLKMIRNDINIIMCPGQHDAVRVAEPQPPIGKDYASPLYEMKNLHLVSNPSTVQISDGFNVLMYHGASVHSFINEIEELRLSKAHDNPARVIKHMLKRRHLAPMHSFVVYIPNDEDPLFIRGVPDIITMGETHRLDIDTYNNILIVASSCWQSITPYEEKVGNNPLPCKVPLMNLKTREIKILDFE